MNRLLLSVALLTATLAACKGERPAAEVPAAPSATAPVASPPVAATFDGYDQLIIGMNAIEMKQAWGRDLDGAPATGKVCYYFTPDPGNPRALAFMMEGDKFVRYDVGNAAQVAPGGGKVGMTAGDIRRLYPDRIEEKPHALVKGGQYLRIRVGDSSSSALLFETDAQGTITGWRVGQRPYVDYTNGCN